MGRNRSAYPLRVHASWMRASSRRTAHELCWPEADALVAAVLSLLILRRLVIGLAALGMASLLLCLALAPEATSVALLLARALSDALNAHNPNGVSAATAVLSAAGIVAAMVSLLDARQHPKPHTGIASCLVLFVLWVFLRAATGASPAAGYQETTRWVAILASFILGACYLSRPRVMERAIVAFGLLQLPVAAWQYASGNAVQQQVGAGSVPRLSGTFIHPAWAGFFAVIALAALPAAKWPGRRLMELCLLGLLVATVSRGPIVFAALVLAASALIYMRPQRLVAVALIPAFVNLIPPLQARFVNEVTAGGLTGSLATRDVLLRAALDVWHQNPVFGAGSGYFFNVASVTIFGSPYEAHSDWLKFLADQGVVGLGLYGGATVVAIATLWRRRALAPAAVMTALLLYGSVDVLHRINTLQVFVWAWVGAQTASTADRTPFGSLGGKTHYRLGSSGAG
jgi:hypothetical protein